MAGFPIPTYTAKRFSMRGRRFYYFVKDGVVSPFYPSATTICQGIPEYDPAYALEKWKDQQGGYHQAQAAMMERADYGSFFHELSKDYFGLIIKYGRNASLPVEEIYSRFRMYAREKGRPDYWPGQNMDTLLRDLAALQAFVIEKEVTPLLVERSLVGEINGHPVAATIDLYGEMTVEEKGYFGDVYQSGPRKGEPKEGKASFRRRGLIDWKSGKSGFYPAHEAQLWIGKKIFEFNFPDHPVEFCCNWAPSEWRTEPGYKLHDWKPAWSHFEIMRMSSYVDSWYLHHQKPIDMQPYQTSVWGALGLEEKLEFRTMTVREYIEAYEGNPELPETFETPE